jgi:hypothetical protein
MLQNRSLYHFSYIHDTSLGDVTKLPLLHRSLYGFSGILRSLVDVSYYCGNVSPYYAFPDDFKYNPVRQRGNDVQ